MRNVNIRWTAFPLSYYSANAVWQGYMSLFYKNLGYSGGQIGLISALMALCALAVQPLWGRLSDQSAKPGRLLCVFSLFSALILPMALVSSGFPLQIAFAVLFYAFYCALLPMGDAILLRSLNREKLHFGPYRLAGAAGFAATGAIFGWILPKTGVNSIIWCSAALLVLSAVSALLLPRSEKVPAEKIAFSKLFRNKDLMILLSFMLPVQMTMGYFYTFFSPYFSALHGGNSALLGLGYALATLSEVPYLLLCDKIFQRFGAAVPMLFSAAVLSVRWLLLGFGRTAAIALASQLLHGGGFIVMTVSMARYISRHVEKELQSSGQMLLSMASFGLARVAGNLGGGFLADRIGSSAVFLVAAGVCLTSAAVFARWAVRCRR